MSDSPDADEVDYLNPGAGRVEAVPEGMGTATRIAGTIFVVGATIFWIWALIIAPRFFSAPDEIEDPAYAIALEQRCAAALAQLDALPSSQSVTTPQERGQLISQANTILQTMRDDLEMIPSDTGNHNDELIDRWLGDWDFYLDDRQVHANKLLAGEDGRFLITTRLDPAINQEVSIGERMAGFARRNDIRSCGLPGDL